MKLFKPHVTNVIFLAPVAIYASQNGGCSNTPEPGPLATAQIEELFVGNTIQAEGNGVYAFVDPNGTWRGVNIPNGAKSGKWRLSDNGVLCSEPDIANSKENCDVVQFDGKDTYDWADGNLKVIKGNPQNL